MAEDKLLERAIQRSIPSLSDDRRVCTELQPPPYLTAEGTIFTDRRSHLDRRSTWIRSFVMDITTGDEGDIGRA